MVGLHVVPESCHAEPVFIVVHRHLVVLVLAHDFRHLVFPAADVVQLRMQHRDTKSKCTQHSHIVLSDLRNEFVQFLSGAAGDSLDGVADRFDFAPLKEAFRLCIPWSSASPVKAIPLGPSTLTQ